METMIDERVQDLINLIHKLGVEQRQTIDFARIAQYFTLDSLTTIAFGKPVGFLIQNQDLYDYNESSSAFYPVLAMGATLETFNDILKSRIVQFLAGPKAKDKAGLGAIIGWAQQIVGERFAEKPTKSKDRRVAMLDSFIDHGLTQLEAESESLLQILAGSDSTATVIRMTVLYLLTNPPVYAKLRAEVDEAVNKDQASSIVRVAEFNSLPYLQAVVKESIRLWQPLTGIATKIAPAEGVTSYGRHIPGGTLLALHIQAITTRKDFFGPDADLFRPQRWLDADPDTLKMYEKIWELTFAGGQYTCPGKNIALMETSKVVFEVSLRVS
jgi:cytochrome P450